MTDKSNKNVGMKQKKKRELVEKIKHVMWTETEGRELDKRIKNRDKLGKYKQWNVKKEHHSPKKQKNRRVSYDAWCEQRLKEERQKLWTAMPVHWEAVRL